MTEQGVFTPRLDIKSHFRRGTDLSTEVEMKADIPLNKGRKDKTEERALVLPNTATAPILNWS